MFLQNYVMNNFLYTPIIIYVLIFFSIFKKRYLSTTRYYIWNIICVGLLIPIQLYENIIFKFKKNNFIEFKSINKIISAVNVNTEQILKINSTNNINNTVSKTSISWLKIIFFIWILGVIIFVSYQIISYLNFKYNVFRWSLKVTDSNILFSWEQVKKELNIRKNIKLRYSHYVKSPLLIGIINPTVILPIAINKEYLKYIFRHELFHYKFFDLWLQCIRLIIQSLYWYNPIIWLLCKQTDEDMERACDEYVLRLDKKDSRKEYANTLIYVISLGINERNSLIVGFGKNNKEIYNRIKEILNMKSRKKGILVIVSIILLIIASGIFVVNGKSNQNIELYSFYVPLNDTLKNLGYDINDKDKNHIIANDKLKQINFVNESGFKLKKDKNTYFMIVEDDIAFIKTDVLKNLGYKIKDINNNLYIETKNGDLSLDIQSYVNSSIDEKNIVYEHELISSDSVFNKKIIKRNAEPKDFKDYTIEEVNIMGYNIDELKQYIEANYNMSLKEYKDNLIEITNKYDSMDIHEFILLEDGQLEVVFYQEGVGELIEIAEEVRDGKIFVEK